jgi:asparagine synthase (glutamine-hydrolysing)
MAVCGIAVTREGRPVGSEEIDAMVSALAVRKGLMGEQHSNTDVGLAAISPTASSHMWKSEQVIVVCDADISNHDVITERIKLPKSDANLAKLLGELYLQSGPEFLAELRGVFAIAIWDCRSKSLLLATDRFGVKPICYAATPSAIVFASQPRGILASGRIDKRVNSLAIVNYFNFSVVPAPLCVFEGITKIQPGNCLTWQNGLARTQQYWQMKYPEDAHVSDRRLARELLERMEEAVRLNSGDLPVSRLGCFLSGGTDSSSIVGLVTRLKKAPVKSVSIAFAEERFNELDYAQIAARHFGSQHIVSRLNPADAFRILPTIVALYDEPYANSSVIPTYHCQTLAREHGLDVMLAGDGGDELFGGNERYRTQQIYELYKKIPEVVRHGLIEPAITHVSPDASGVGGKIRRYIQTSNTPNPDRYFRWSMLQYFSPEQILGAGLPFRNGHSDLLAVARAHYHGAFANEELNRLLYIDIRMTLSDNDLPKVARAAELAGVNVRFPFLDHPLVEFSGHLPARLKVKGLEKRYLFKLATRNLLPKPILRKRKHGFGLPIGLWLKTDPKLRGMAEDVLRDPRTYQRGYFQRPFIEKIFAAMDQDDTPFYGDVLWPFLMLELWHRHHVECTA